MKHILDEFGGSIIEIVVGVGLFIIVFTVIIQQFCY